MVMKQIQEQKLLIKVVFVGPHLHKVVDYLENHAASYLVLGYAPSAITLKHSLVPIMFPQCKDPLLQRDGTDTNCLYTANRLAKVVWNPIQNEAPAFYKFIQHFGLSYEEYVQLLDTYNSRNAENDSDYDDVACKWLKKRKSEKNTVYEHRLDNLPMQGKHELYIGGIFPITGKRYRAPELAQGNQDQIVDKSNTHIL